ncbi:MAG: lipid II flippase MurJ, partial [Lentisphaeria bacterium]|nr:lipid II flippase MurJ [Lentisphaeria bacterium]NQZ67962.1 lipid II flippase MurJ [Lentisphaeria bacterium]
MSKIKAIIAKGFAVSTICTLFSRISGFARDIIFAGIWGTGPVISAFLLAFTIPNMFRRLLGEGALSEVFIPIYNEKLTKDGKESAFEFLNQILSLLILALSLL